MDAAVSIIVPIYHGKQYIEQMIRQIEVCSEAIAPAAELLLVNDDPEVPIETELYSDKIRIRVFNTDRNRGIHGARVKGLREAEGEYILFLDQDDRIFPLYLKSQIEKIGCADAVVCRLIDGKRIYYDEQRSFEKAVDKDYLIGKGNIIVSPGQVLMRRQSVSDAWQQQFLHNNGADDWFLWICMLSEGKRFRLNEDILFEHVIEGNNASLQTAKMIRSQREVVELVKKAGLLSEHEMDMLEHALWEDIYEKMELLDKHRKMVLLYDEWMSLNNRGVRLTASIKDRGYHTCAIYGIGAVGKQIYEALEGTDIAVCYFIDRSQPYLGEAVPVYRPEEELPEVDVIILSLVEQEEPVRKLLSEKMNADIWTITELIKSIY